MEKRKWLSYSEYKKLKKPQKNKYNAKRTIVDGISFPSQLEANTYRHLKTMKEAGEIQEIELQSTVHLTLAKIAYKTDFKVSVNSQYAYWVEAKGKEMDTFKLKKRLWVAGYGPGELHIYKAGRGPFGVSLAEIIKPK